MFKEPAPLCFYRVSGTSLFLGWSLKYNENHSKRRMRRILRWCELERGGCREVYMFELVTGISESSGKCKLSYVSYVRPVRPCKA